MIVPVRTAATTAALRRVVHLVVLGDGRSVSVVQLSPAEAAHMSDPGAETAEPCSAAKSRPTVEAATMEPSEAMETTGAKSEAGEPAEGIAVAIIRPVVVTRRALGIVAGFSGRYSRNPGRACIRVGRSEPIWRCSAEIRAAPSGAEVRLPSSVGPQTVPK